MVNITRTRYVTPKPMSPLRKKGAAAVESHPDKRQPSAKTLPSTDRRKGKDRRNKRDKNGRLVYDMRSGRGRRKTDHIPPSIELDV